MAERDCDLFVIGGGSGGVRAARIAASHGARVIIAEEHRYGGTCVIRGCVPKKLFVYASSFRRDFADAPGYGWSVPEPSFDWPTLVRQKDAEIDRLNQLYIRGLANAGVEILDGRARLADAHTIVIGDRRVTADRILVATGGRPWTPGFPGADLTISSNEAFYLAPLPRRIAIAGGGYIAIEFAHIFAGLGVETTLVHRGDLVLRGFDDDVRTRVTADLRAAGVELHLHAIIDRVDALPGGARKAHLSSGAELEVDVVMGALGRRPNTADLGLEEAGVALGKNGAIVVNDRAATSAGHIFAVGDCTDRIQLTPVAIREGHAFADREFGGREVTVDYDLVPTAVFAQPPAASVGLPEDEARRRGLDVAVFESDFRPMKNTLSGRDERVLIKLIVDRASDRVVGVHMVGEGAAEIVQTAAIALQAGATKAHFDATVALHPTTAEELVLMRSPVR